jgi:hypothetical protein
MPWVEDLGYFFVPSLHCGVLHFPAMAQLTKADAARQLGIARSTFYKLIDQGKISPTPDGMID